MGGRLARRLPRSVSCYDSLRKVSSDGELIPLRGRLVPQGTRFPPADPKSVLSSLLEGPGPFSILHPFEYLKSASFPFLESAPEFLLPVLLGWGLGTPSCPPPPHHPGSHLYSRPPSAMSTSTLQMDRSTGPRLCLAGQSMGCLVGIRRL